MQIGTPFPKLRHYIEEVLINNDAPPIAEIILQYASDLQCILEHCQGNPISNKLYQEKAVKAVALEYEMLLQIPDLLLSQISESSLKEETAIHAAYPLLAEPQKFDVGGIKAYRNEIEKLQSGKDPQQQLHAIERMQATGYLLLSPYVEEIEKSNVELKILKKTLLIAREFKKWLGVSSKECYDMLSRRDENQDLASVNHSSLAIFSLVNFENISASLTNGNEIHFPDFRIAIKNLASRCKIINEKGFFLHRLITYWDSSLNFGIEEKRMTFEVYQKMTWGLAKEILEEWKEEKTAILSTVNSCGETLLVVADRYKIGNFSQIPPAAAVLEPSFVKADLGKACCVIL